MGIKQKEENTNGGLHNTLAAGTTVKGDIVTETDFRLDGKIEGDVSCNGKIVIGPKGNVTGNIVSKPRMPISSPMWRERTMPF